MTLELRAASEADMAALLAMMERFYAIDAYPFDPLVARRALGDLIADPSLGGVWLAELGGAPVGYLVLTLCYSLEFHGRDAFIDELYLEAEHRGRGLGGQLLAFAEQECRARGVHAIHLEVERENLAAQALYRRWSFRETDRFLMTKRLG